MRLPALIAALGSADPRARDVMVRAEGLEPPRLSSLEPKSSASTSSATPAKGSLSAVLARPERERRIYHAEAAAQQKNAVRRDRACSTPLPKPSERPSTVTHSSWRPTRRRIVQGLGAVPASGGMAAAPSHAAGPVTRRFSRQGRPSSISAAMAARSIRASTYRRPGPRSDDSRQSGAAGRGAPRQSGSTGPDLDPLAWRAGFANAMDGWRGRPDRARDRHRAGRPTIRFVSPDAGTYLVS